MNEEIELLENIIDERDDEISALKLQLQKLLSPPEQEPVAWHYIYDDGITVRERVTECMPLGEHYTITPLYTKREPFGPEERERLSRAYSTQAEQVAFEEGIIFAEISYGIGGVE